VRDRRVVVLAGALLSLVVAVALFSRYGINGTLSRDEAIYAYGGLQIDRGVPFYASIFDPKTPGAAYVAALGAELGGLEGVRIAFFVCACLTVVAVYLLALELWGSVLAALIAAVAFASFRGFAMDALSGPDAKTPGILMAVLSMLFMVRRQWLWAGLCGSLAFLVWQPLGIFAAVAVVASRRWRAVLGVALPLAVTVVYFWIAGALGDFVQAALAFPVEGVHRGSMTVPERLEHIAAVVHEHYHGAVVQFWAGLALIAVLAAWRRRWVVLAPLAVIAAFSAHDFQGYPDVYPLLPFAALGLGGAAALVLRARVLRTTAVAALALMTLAAWTQFSTDPAAADTLAAQRAAAADLQHLLRPGETIYALGDPAPLVLTDRRNPNRYIYMGSGVSLWDFAHTPGGFAGWKATLRADDPAIIVIHGWHGPYEQRATAWLQRIRYKPSWDGCWRVYLRPDVAVRDPERPQADRALCVTLRRAGGRG
jgi:hypothetical protein